MKQSSLDAISKVLEHTFKDENLLKDALTLASGSQKSAYERLEFLGDRVLGLAISDMLYKGFPLEDEGKLAHRHTALVRLETVARVAKIIGLDKLIEVPKSEVSNMERKPSSFLCDICEAVLGALYLDAGYDKAFKIVYKYWKPLMDEDITPPIDAKSALQEWTQRKKLPLPIYQVIEMSGPAHSPSFIVEVLIDGYARVSGSGSSKRSAEQEAATKFLGTLKSQKYSIKNN